MSLGAITKYRILSGLKNKFILLQFWKSEIEKGHFVGKIKVLVRLVSFQGSREDSVSFVFQLLEPPNFLG